MSSFMDLKGTEVLSLSLSWLSSVIDFPNIIYIHQSFHDKLCNSSKWFFDFNSRSFSYGPLPNRWSIFNIGNGYRNWLSCCRISFFRMAIFSIAKRKIPRFFEMKTWIDSAIRNPEPANVHTLLRCTYNVKVSFFLQRRALLPDLACGKCCLIS